MGKNKKKYIYFSEIDAAYDLKVVRCIQLNHYMKLREF